MGWIVAVFQSASYVLGLLGLYYFHGNYQNESYGYNQIETSAEFLTCSIFSIIFCTYLLVRRYKKSSDYFLLLYGLIVIVPYGVLHGISRVEGGQVEVDIILLLIPYLVVMLICKANVRYPNILLIHEDNILKFFLLLSVITIVMLIINSPSQASFSLIDSYGRRLEARDTYGSGTFIAYSSSMVMNGLLPLYAFLGAYNKKIVYLFLSVFLYSIFFYIYGVKAPLLYIIFAGILGYSIKNSSRQDGFYRLFHYIFIGLIAFACLEILLFEYSYIEDYLIRRVFYVGGYLVGVYFNFMDSNQFSWVAGLLDPTNKGISLYIGEDFLGIADTNANTNTFLYFLAQYGVLGYLISVIIVGVFLSMLDCLGAKNKVIVFISVLYSILILEQSATTALVSSGIGLICVLYYLTIPRAE
jgi:hypothetical protein